MYYEQYKFGLVPRRYEFRCIEKYGLVEQKAVKPVSVNIYIEYASWRSANLKEKFTLGCLVLPAFDFDKGDIIEGLICSGIGEHLGVGRHLELRSADLN